MHEAHSRLQLLNRSRIRSFGCCGTFVRCIQLLAQASAVLLLSLRERGHVVAKRRQEVVVRAAMLLLCRDRLQASATAQRRLRTCLVKLLTFSRTVDDNRSFSCSSCTSQDQLSSSTELERTRFSCAASSEFCDLTLCKSVSAVCLSSCTVCETQRSHQKYCNATHLVIQCPLEHVLESANKKGAPRFA